MPKSPGAPTRVSGRTLVPSARVRAGIVKRLAATTGAINTAALAEIDVRHPWFSELDPATRSWITLVARAGIEGFVTWLSDDADEPMAPESLFNAAPPSVMRRITLHQTVELVRTTIDVVEAQVLELLPRGDRPILQNAIVIYSREIAFAAAELYARRAEVRGAWDARLEALVVDAVVRGEANEQLASRASTLGWRSAHPVFVMVGMAPEQPDPVIAELRHEASRAGLDLLASTQANWLVVVLGSPAVTTDEAAEEVAGGLAEYFATGPIVVGPLAENLVEAGASARAAFSGVRAAAAWPEAPRPVSALALLPERALAGDGNARRILATDVYRPLVEAGGELLATLVSFLDNYGSVEATARQLFVHPNTVRYRVRRIHEVTGYSPAAARDAYLLRLALTVGRLLQPTLTAEVSRPQMRPAL